MLLACDLVQPPGLGSINQHIDPLRRRKGQHLGPERRTRRCVDSNDRKITIPLSIKCEIERPGIGGINKRSRTCPQQAD